MPFQSRAQQKYLFAKHPELAREFAAKTPDFKALPERKVKPDEKKAAMAREFGVKKTLNDNSPRMERRFAVKKTLNDNTEKTATFTAAQIEKMASTIHKLPKPIQHKIASYARKQINGYEALQRVFGYKTASVVSQSYLTKVAWAQILAALAPTAIDLGIKAFGGNKPAAGAAPGVAGATPPATPTGPGVMGGTPAAKPPAIHA